MQYNYLNGRFLYKNESKISTEDRGFNFADGIYEVIAFRKKKLLNYSKHINRLKCSLESLKINSPFANLNSLNLILKYLENNKRHLVGYYKKLNPICLIAQT